MHLARLAICALLGLSGCSRAAHTLAGVAESTRTATEQMVATSEIANDRLESKIDPDARTMRQTPGLKLTQRFETREGPDGYMIYDTESHQIARIQGQNQSGLTYEDAERAQEALVSADMHKTEPTGPPTPKGP